MKLKKKMVKKNEKKTKSAQSIGAWCESVIVNPHRSKEPCHLTFIATLMKIRHIDLQRISPISGDSADGKL